MIRIQLTIPEPGNHLVSVEMRLQPRLARLCLQLPGWTPGSYLIRDYVRNLEGLQVCQGDQPVAVDQLGPAWWRLQVDPTGPELVIRYRVIATELSVRTPHLDDQHGFLPLAAVVLEVEGERWTPHQLRLALPADWRAFIPLPGDPRSGVTARDLDHLFDSPLEIGPHRALPFSVAGVPHQWVTWAGQPEQAQWLLDRHPTLLADVEQVCLACCRLMGVDRPASDAYLVILHLLDEAYGGLEHDDAMVLVYGRRTLEKPDGYRRFLQLIAHEYLHQWNVRRLRPAELTPIDYHQPVSVPTLWFAEGITSYVDQLLPLVAGLSTPEELLEDLGAELSRYRLTPGRAVQSLRSSSQEAWVKLYKADAYAGDSQISYYLKGAVLALCLDLHLRAAGSCLAQVLQELWLSHGRWGRGYSEADLIAAFTGQAADLATLLPAWLESVDDPDLDGYLRTIGLRLEPVEATIPWTGLTVAAEGGRLLAQRVRRGSPAEQAGLMVGDELIAIDGQRLADANNLAAALQAGQLQELLTARRRQLRALTLCSQAPQPERYQLVIDPAASADAVERRLAWLALVPSRHAQRVGAASW
ncbi:MAG: M61 family metallopeptidase [Vulcanococcus sp.]